MDEKQEILQKRLAELPADVREAIVSTNVSEKIRAIGQRNSLHIDQLGDLEDETLLVMLGFADSSEFGDALQKTLRVEEPLARQLAQEINNEVFASIRESMQNFAQRRASEAPAQETPEKPAPTAPPALPAVEHMLTEPTISTSTPLKSTPPPAPSQGEAYKADPYREPLA